MILKPYGVNFGRLNNSNGLKHRKDKPQDTQ